MILMPDFYRLRTWQPTVGAFTWCETKIAGLAIAMGESYAAIVPEAIVSLECVWLKQKIRAARRIVVAKSCKLCGEFKDAKHFNVAKGGYLQSYCHTCTNRLYRPAATVHQQKALTVARNHRQRWTDGEDETALAMAAEGLPARTIALALGRTVYAVQTRLTQMEK